MVSSGNGSSAVVGTADERQGTARYLQALAQHWPFILASVALALAAAIAYLATAENRYEAHADVLVTPVSINDTGFVGLPVIRESGEGRGVLTAARLVETPQVADSARRQLQLRTTREDLFQAVHVEPQEQSNIVTITAEADSAERAAAIANAFAIGVIAERTRLFQRDLRPLIARLARRHRALPEESRDTGEGRALAERLATLRGLTGAKDPTLQIASLAVPPASAAWPRSELSIAVALFVGILFGIGVAIALELVNPLVLRDEDVLEERLPLLARVPRVTMGNLQSHVQREAPFGADVRDAYQLGRVNVSAALDGEQGTILVTSAARGEGKTTAAVCLALVYARAGRRVVLVDADLRRARLARVLGVAPGHDGLRELLLDETSAELALAPVRGYEDRLHVVISRTEDREAFDLLQEHRIETLVAELREHADIVVFDSPPVTEAADALLLARAVDAVVLVVWYGRTRRDLLARARTLLEQLGVVPAGIIAVTRRQARLPARLDIPGRPQELPSESRVRAGSGSTSRSG